MKENDLKEKYNDKKVLITGGLGMIGSSLAVKLVQNGARVEIVDACLDPYGFNKFNVKEIEKDIKIHIVDIRDKKKMIRIIEKSEIIFNLAGQVSHNDSLNNPFLDAEINYIGHLNIMDIIKTVNPKIKVLYAGSRLQYGKILTNPVRENHSMNPLTPYALNKTAAENLYLFYHRLYGIPVVLFRISNPYGPRGQIKHSKYCMVNWFIRQAMENKEITIFGDGLQTRDYIYIDDLVDAYALAGIESLADGEIFNVGLGKGVTFKQMSEIVVEIVGKGKLKHIPWPENYINVETGGYVADINKIRETLNWNPNIDLKQGVKNTFEYYKKYNQYYI